MFFIYLGVCLALLLLLACYVIIPGSSIRNLRGPPSRSWVIGAIRDLEIAPVGECEFSWAKQYGHSYRLRAGFGEDIFMTADPKAMQFLLQTSSYNVLRAPFALQRGRNLFGVASILSTDGNAHKRCRKVMLPAFGFPETKALTQVFQSKAAKLASQWKEKLSADQYLETNVHRWLARATLDALGEAAFDYHFGAMDDDDNELGNVYQNMLIKAGAHPSYIKSAWNNFVALLSLPMANLVDVPTRAKSAMNRSRNISRDVAGKLFDEKWSVSDPESGIVKRDVMSLLVKANSTEDGRTKLTREEVLDQMGAIIFAGHETTSNVLTWSLWELAKNQGVQSKLREEILQYAQPNSEEVSVSEYENMKYTVAFIKEIFRMHPIVTKIIRHTAKDLLVPLLHPIRDESGNVITQVPIKKNMRFFCNIVAYNRDPELWGDDPHVFRPERWFELEEKEKKDLVKFGVYGNLGIFGAGIHACIGWRFALYELQSFLISLVQNFQFDLLDNPPKVRRTYALLMVPQVEGDEEQTSMPLKISAYKN